MLEMFTNELIKVKFYFRNFFASESEKFVGIKKS